MGNEMKNVARGFKFLWATFSETMGNVFSRHGQCFLSLSVGCPLVVRGLSVGCPWVTPVGFTPGNQYHLLEPQSGGKRDTHRDAAMPHLYFFGYTVPPPKA